MRTNHRIINVDTYGTPKVGIAPSRFVHAADAAAKFYLGVSLIVSVLHLCNKTDDFVFSALECSHHARKRELGLAA